jgi:hypothetical protein
MWRLPGYVGVCQSSRYHRDVVAAMVPISGEGFSGDGQSEPHPLLVRAAKDVAPHWSVNFWVHDADAVAARAAELGGEGGFVPLRLRAGRKSSGRGRPTGRDAHRRTAAPRPLRGLGSNAFDHHIWCMCWANPCKRLGYAHPGPLLVLL